MKILNIKTEKRLLGNTGEDAAAKHLKKHGYKIIERNYVAVGYEIDIIAESKNTLSFIEVKSRTIRDEEILSRPAAAVTPDKQRKIITAAKFYANGHGNKKKINLDVIEVYFKIENGKKVISNIEHLICAYNMNTAFDR